jgi:hypothetical protein
MLNGIGETAMQQHMRMNHNVEIFDKDQAIRKTEKNRAQRPVEKSEAGGRSEMGLQSGDSMRSRNSLEDGKLIIEKYDAAGKLVKKIPPGFLPFGEAA